MLHVLKSAAGSRRRPLRVGRGISAGRGKTAGRGTKGQKARAGKGRRLGFEGGQTPLLRRQPKLSGFRNPAKKMFEILSVHLLEEKLAAGSYTRSALREMGLLRTEMPVKLLGKSKLSKKFELTIDAASKGARASIEQAGGSVRIL